MERGVEGDGWSGADRLRFITSLRTSPQQLTFDFDFVLQLANRAEEPADGLQMAGS